MDNNHQRHRPLRLAFYLLALLLLQLVPSADPKLAPQHNEDAYESKLNEALKYYSDNIESLTASSHEKGSAQIEPDGETQLEFASVAVDNELRRLHLLGVFLLRRFGETRVLVHEGLAHVGLPLAEGFAVLVCPIGRGVDLLRRRCGGIGGRRIARAVHVIPRLADRLLD